jgi:two-component system CheB/CheR fusion protein
MARARGGESVTAIVAAAVRDLTGADGATFVLKDGALCYYCDENAIGPLWKGQRFQQSACISGWVMQHGQNVVVEDIAQDSRIPLDAYAPTFVKSMAMVPIRSLEPLGAIGAYWSRPHKASEAEVTMLAALADAASVAFENIELYSSLDRRVQELTEASKSKDEFLAVLSHELRTPLTAIRGWSQFLLSGTVSDNETRAGLAAIERNARAQELLVNDLLDVSRILSGRLRVEPKAIALAEPVLEAVEALRGAATARGVMLNVMANTASVLSGDAGRIRQIATNIIGNAIKFSEGGSEVTVSLFDRGPEVVLQVVDQGRGIPAKVLPRVFERFWQADSSLSRRTGGLGLGLSIVKHLVEAHGGSVSAESLGAGRGATFTASFPRL